MTCSIPKWFPAIISMSIALFTIEKNMCSGHKSLIPGLKKEKEKDYEFKATKGDPD